MKMHRIWDRSRGRVQKLATGLFLISIMFLYPTATFGKCHKRLDNFLFLTSPPTQMLHNTFSN